MCSINKFNEYCDIFEGRDFGLSALNFFVKIGHTLADIPYLVADDISYCIYFKLGFNHIFTKQESDSFSYIKQLALLFQLNDDVFERATNRIIKYYAIELSVTKSDRSNIAHIIHNAFSRESECSTVIIFRNYEECMISISYGKALDICNKVYLSDWISTNSNIDYIEKIEANNLSSKSNISFLSDFIYYSSREYYLHSLSKEYIVYNQIIDFDLFKMDYKLDKDAIEEFVEDVFNRHIYIYGDDYVDITEFKEPQMESDFDFNFDLLEFEMELESDEKNEYGEYEEEYDDEYKEEYDDEYDDEYDEEYEGFIEDNEEIEQRKQIDINDIEENILSDPIKLLKWLENFKRKNKTI